MTKTKSKGILFIDRARLDLYLEGTPNIVSLEFLPNSVKDLEIINREEFSKQLSLFIKEHQLIPAFLTVIFSDALSFENKFSTKSHPDVRKDIEDFLSEVPFDQVNSKLYNLPSGEIKAIAVNQDFFAAIKETFEKHEFKVDGAIPLSILGIALTDKNQLDVVTAQTILAKIEDFKQFSLAIEKTEIKSQSAASQEEKIKRPRPFLIMLLTVFFVLAAILVVFLVRK